MSCGNLFFRYRNVIFPLFAAFLLLSRKPEVLLGNRWADAPAMAFGISTVILGLYLRMLTISLSYIKRGGKGKSIYAKRLVKDGMYAHVRNPMYLANLMIVLGFSLVYGSIPLMMASMFFFGFVYLSIILAEEEHLKKSFGSEYESYLREVPRLIPRLKGIKETIGCSRRDWKKSVRKDYGTALGLLFGLYSLVLWKLQRAYGIREIHSGPLLFLTGVLIFGLTYLYLRHLKKTGKLG